jgi:hypothetical protein
MATNTKFKFVNATLAVTGSIAGALWVVNKGHPNESILTDRQASIAGTITLLAFGGYVLDLIFRK